MNNFDFKTKKPTPTSKDVNAKVDDVLKEKYEKPLLDRVRIAHEIKQHPPKPGFMKTDVKPAIYSIDLNTDAHWWFNHVCTVFPLLLDQGIRTHMDLKDSFKPEKRLPDVNYMFILWIAVGIVAIFGVTKFLGLW